ncbi:hypothetical protein BT93_C2077 [Corymbia citriodora subsp. variegata]|nr:hypothetical protein BT93_C2077 [Corymbia citriodora subsp. variegata]
MDQDNDSSDPIMFPEVSVQLAKHFPRSDCCLGRRALSLLSLIARVELEPGGLRRRSAVVQRPCGYEVFLSFHGASGESRISIEVFSENYGSSGWCLDELVRIVECEDTMGQVVWPVFYKVDPSELRNQMGRYGQALIDHEERSKSKGDSEKVKRWRKALTKAATISGWHLVDEYGSHLLLSDC